SRTHFFVGLLVSQDDQGPGRLMEKGVPVRDGRSFEAQTEQESFEWGERKSLVSHIHTPVGRSRQLVPVGYRLKVRLSPGSRPRRRGAGPKSSPPSVAGSTAGWLPHSPAHEATMPDRPWRRKRSEEPGPLD